VWRVAVDDMDISFLNEVLLREMELKWRLPESHLGVI